MRSAKYFFFILAVVASSLALTRALDPAKKELVSKAITAIEARPTTSVTKMTESKELVHLGLTKTASVEPMAKKFPGFPQLDLMSAAGEKKYMLVKKKPKVKKIKMEVYKPKMKYKKIKMKVPVKKMKKKKVKGYMVKKKHHHHEY